MRRLALALLVLVTACDLGGFPSSDRDTARLQGPRVDLGPGDIQEIPVIVDAPDFDSVDLVVTATVVSHGSELGVVPHLELVSPSGDAEVDRDNPLMVRCTDDCAGEHTVSVSLPAEAQEPVTFALGVDARGDGRNEGLLVELGQAAEASLWTNPSPNLWNARETAGRLHITSTLDPEGDLRLETPATDIEPAPRSVIVGDSTTITEVPPGTSLDLSPPDDSCDAKACDWSIGLAAVAPWQVAATSNEFDVSFSYSDEVIEGQTSWRDTVEAHSTRDMRLETVSPASPAATSLMVAVQVIFWTNSAPPELVIRFGGREITHPPVSTEATLLVIPLDCGDDRCSASMPVSIDATSLAEDIGLELRLTGRQAQIVPLAGEIELELQP